MRNIKYLIQIADKSLDGYELLALISHMSTYARSCLTNEQKEIVDNVENALNYIYVRDQLKDGDKDGANKNN